MQKKCKCFLRFGLQLRLKLLKVLGNAEINSPLYLCSVQLFDSKWNRQKNARELHWLKWTRNWLLKCQYSRSAKENAQLYMSLTLSWSVNAPVVLHRANLSKLQKFMQVHGANLMLWRNKQTVNFNLKLIIQAHLGSVVQNSYTNYTSSSLLASILDNHRLQLLRRSTIDLQRFGICSHPVSEDNTGQNDTSTCDRPSNFNHLKEHQSCKVQ